MAQTREAPDRIVPKNDLRKKVREVRRKSPDDDPVLRAEAALQLLSRHFDGWMAEEVEVMAHAAAAWADTGHADVKRRDSLYRTAHDLKGQATTLGFPLVSRAAGSLCLLLDLTDRGVAVPGPLVDAHVDGIRAIYRERAKDENDRIGATLVETLEAVTRSFVADNGGPTEADDGPLF